LENSTRGIIRTSGIRRMHHELVKARWHYIWQPDRQHKGAVTSTRSSDRDCLIDRGSERHSYFGANQLDLIGPKAPSLCGSYRDRCARVGSPGSDYQEPCNTPEGGERRGAPSRSDCQAPHQGDDSDYPDRTSSCPAIGLHHQLRRYAGQLSRRSRNLALLANRNSRS
jgi:hypothetical protein